MLTSLTGKLNEQVFFELLRAGLWEEEVRLSKLEPIDFDAVYKLAEQQSVVGLVAAGIEHVSDVKLPQSAVFPFMGAVLTIEQRNKAMNAFVAKLQKRMDTAGIKAILVKGQGIAQCYERPLWRACGDVDLLLDKENYQKAKALLTPYASTVDVENMDNCHLALTISDYVVELHGTLRPDMGRKIDCYVDKIQREVLANNGERIWHDGEVDISLPSADNDVIFVFTHILQHFYRGGIGLRQVCDWCQLLWTCRDEINRDLLEKRLQDMGLVPEWRAFAYLAVNELGMPSDAMPIYSDELCWKKKAESVLVIIMESGNFGQNKDWSYYDKHHRMVSKAISLWKHTEDSYKLFKIFPGHAVLSWWRMVTHGIKWAKRGA